MNESRNGRPGPGEARRFGRAGPGEGPRFARPYALTGGRTRSDRMNLTLDTLVLTNPFGRAATRDLPPERREIVLFCAEAISVAELSALLRVPIGVARVLASDMHGDGYLDAHKPMQEGADLTTLLERVLDGLRVL